MRLVSATWTLQGYFICSFHDKILLVMHPSGKRYWIKQWRHNQAPDEWFGSIFCVPARWKPCVQRAIWCRNYGTQYPIWFNNQLNNYEIIQLPQVIQKTEWLLYPPMDDMPWVNQSPSASILFTKNKAVALILFRHQRLVQVYIHPRDLLEEISSYLETWIHEHIHQLPSLEEEIIHDSVVVQTFPVSQCPSIFQKALSKVEINDRSYILEEKKTHTLLSQHALQPVSLETVVQQTTTYEANYWLDSRLVALTQWDSESLLWYTMTQDSVTVWKTTRSDVIKLTKGGRIVEYFSVDAQGQHHLVYSTHGMPPNFRDAWSSTISMALRWRNQVTASLLRFQPPPPPPPPLSAIHSSPRTVKTRQASCKLDVGDFQLDKQGYLSCHFQQGMFILFHPNRLYATMVTHKGREFRILWRQSILFRHYFEKICQIYDYLLLSPLQQREIQISRQRLQRQIAMELRATCRAIVSSRV